MLELKMATIPLDIFMTVTEKNDQPCIELRRAIFNPDLIKQILIAAFKQYPIPVQPAFTNRMKSIMTLQDKGIIYEENGQLFFTR